MRMSGCRVYSAYSQQGLVLFFTLVTLLAISLAAVTLIRSVDTSTLVAGNLVFKRSATISADAGMEAAISWLVTQEAANSTINVLTNPNHPFNRTNLNSRPGYHSNADPALNLLADETWNATNSVSLGTDASGNTVRYIIQRMCRLANQPTAYADCLFSGTSESNSGQSILLPQEVCSGPGCPTAGQSAQIRITARAEGPRNTVSYIQAFVY